MEYSTTTNYVSASQPGAPEQGGVYVTQPAPMGMMHPQQQQFGMGMGQMQAVPGQPIIPPPVIITPQHFLPYDTMCPHCRAQVKTQTSYTIGGAAWLWCCVLGWSGLVAGCCVIPFFMDSCKDATHTCPSCSKEVASYKRLHTTPRTRRGYVGHY